MLKKVLFTALIATFTFSGLNFAQYFEIGEDEEIVLSEEADKEVIKGTVNKIAQDLSYIIVDKTKILTTKELLEDSFMMEGDTVEIIVEKTDKGLKAVDYRYIFGEEIESPLFEEEAPLESDRGKYW